MKSGPPSSHIVLRTVLVPLNLVRRLFFSPLRVETSQGKLRVAFGPEPTKTEQAPAAAAVEPELDAIRSELKALLGQHAGTRTAMRHLATLESRLKRDGLSAIDDLPLKVLLKAQDQLESLINGAPAKGLGSLQSRLSVAIIKQEQPDTAETAPSNQYLSDFNVTNKVLVMDASASDFDAAYKDLPEPSASQAREDPRSPPMMQPATAAQKSRRS